MDVCKRVFALVDPDIEVVSLFNDGDEIKCKDLIATVKGNARNILIAERTALNLMQRMSAIATKTRAAVKAIEGTNAKICDTRKTTPLLRVLEKYAVVCGGGTNHRYNLSDGVLIKDNHIAASGGITAAVKKARSHVPHTLKIEVETETLEQVKEALSAGADIIMLDNMTYDEMTEAVKIINKRAVVEASGNMGEKDLKKVALTGVDLISIGALTHSIKAADISLKLKLNK